MSETPSLIRPVPKRTFLPTLDRYEPLVLDHSATKAFKECPRKYFYRYVLGRKSKEERNALVFAWGNAAHKFMEVVYDPRIGGNYDVALGQALKVYKVPGPDDTKKHHLLYSPARFVKMTQLLWDFYTQEMRQNRTIEAIEQPFSVDLPSGMQTGGRFDQIIRMGGKAWVRDWKTTSQQISFFAMGFNPNDQATRYVYALSRLAGWSAENPSPNLKAEGIIFVVIQNMESESSLKIESLPITKNLFELSEWERDQELIYKTLTIYRDLDHWPKTENNCSWCDYRQVCAVGADSTREYMLKSNFDLAPWNYLTVEQGRL